MMDSVADDDSGWSLMIYCGIFLVGYFAIVLYLKVTTARCTSTVHLSGKIAIVTGANQGKLFSQDVFI